MDSSRDQPTSWMKAWLTSRMVPGIGAVSAPLPPPAAGRAAGAALGAEAAGAAATLGAARWTLAAEEAARGAWAPGSKAGVMTASARLSSLASDTS